MLKVKKERPIYPGLSTVFEGWYVVCDETINSRPGFLLSHNFCAEDLFKSLAKRGSIKLLKQFIKDDLRYEFENAES